MVSSHSPLSTCRACNCCKREQAQTVPACSKESTTSAPPRVQSWTNYLAHNRQSVLAGPSPTAVLYFGCLRTDFCNFLLHRLSQPGIKGPEFRKVKSVRVVHPNWAQNRVCLVPVNITFVAGLERAKSAALVARSAHSIPTLVSFSHTHTLLRMRCEYGPKPTLQGRNGKCTGRPESHAK